jgi:branched-chain amino acid transport system substrate-binding protein
MILKKIGAASFFLFILMVSRAPASSIMNKKITVGLASNFSEVSSSASNPYGNYFLNGIELALKKNAKELKAQGIEINLKKFDYGIDQTKIISVVGDATKSDAIAVLGYNYSSHALVAAPLHVQNKLPMITPSSTANRLSAFGSYIHPTCFDNSFMGAALARIANEQLRVKRVAIVVAADCAYCQDLTNAFKAEFEKYGHKIKIFQVLDGDLDFEPVAKEIKADGKYQAVLVPNHELTSAKIISALLNEGVHIPFLGGDGWGNVGEEFFGIIKNKEMEGYTVSHWNRDNPSPASKNFIKDYFDLFGKKPNDTSVLAYDSMSFVLKVIMEEKAYTRESLELALAKDRKYKGITGDYFFVSGKAPKKSLVVLKVKSQKFQFLKTMGPKI